MNVGQSSNALCALNTLTVQCPTAVATSSLLYHAYVGDGGKIFVFSCRIMPEIATWVGDNEGRNPAWKEGVPNLHMS